MKRFSIIKFYTKNICNSLNKRLFQTLSRYQEEYIQSLDDKVNFWDKESKQIHWNKKCTQVLDTTQLHAAKWFVGSELNMSYNCIDRHVEAGFGDQIAVIYDSPITGLVQKITYKELHDSVSRLAGVFAKYGVTKGDRVLIYLPMIPQTLITMLACARLGAIHSLVFGGFAARELSVRIKHCEVKSLNQFHI